VKPLPGCRGRKRKVVIQNSGRGGKYEYNGKYIEAVVACITTTEFAWTD
jgi:hypothetical protein